MLDSGNFVIRDLTDGDPELDMKKKWSRYIHQNAASEFGELKLFLFTTDYIDICFTLFCCKL